MQFFVDMWHMAIEIYAYLFVRNGQPQTQQAVL